MAYIPPYVISKLDELPIMEVAEKLGIPMTKLLIWFERQSRNLIHRAWNLITNVKISRLLFIVLVIVWLVLSVLVFILAINNENRRSMMAHHECEVQKSKEKNDSLWKKQFLEESKK